MDSKIIDKIVESIRTPVYSSLQENRAFTDGILALQEAIQKYLRDG